MDFKLVKLNRDSQTDLLLELSQKVSVFNLLFLFITFYFDLYPLTQRVTQMMFFVVVFRKIDLPLVFSFLVPFFGHTFIFALQIILCFSGLFCI